MRAMLRVLGSLCLIGAVGVAVYYAFIFKQTIHVSGYEQALHDAEVNLPPGMVTGGVNNLGLIADRICGLLFAVVLAIFGAASTIVGQRWNEEESTKSGTPNSTELGSGEDVRPARPGLVNRNLSSK